MRDTVTPQTEWPSSFHAQLAGQWVAVARTGKSSDSPSVLVDFDTEIDQLCQRLAASGRSGLVIYRYPTN